MYSNVCSSCYVMKRQARLSLWFSRPASRLRTEEKEVQEQSAEFFTVGKSARCIRRSSKNALNPTLMNINHKNFLSYTIHNSFAAPVAACLVALYCLFHYNTTATQTSFCSVESAPSGYPLEWGGLPHTRFMSKPTLRCWHQSDIILVGEAWPMCCCCCPLWQGGTKTGTYRQPVEMCLLR